MSWIKHNIGSNASANFTQALLGGFEQSIFMNPDTGQQIFWEHVLFDGPYKPRHMIVAYPVLFNQVINNATIQVSDATTGSVLATGVAKYAGTINGIGTPYVNNAKVQFTFDEDHDWFLQII